MKIHIGKNALSGKSINLPLEELMKTHSVVFGRTRMGKSYLLEMIARAVIDAGFSLIFLDGKGDLFDNLQKFSASRKLESKTVLVDPSDTTQSVGINYLELFGDTTPDALAELVLEGMMKFFKEDQDYKPWLEEWGPASLQPLIKGGFTLLELFQFTSLEDPKFRDALLSILSEPFYQQKWQELRAAFRPHEQAAILNVVRTRASKFWSSEPLKYIFGQSKTSIDWLKLMNTGGILLANLARRPNLPEKTVSFIGTAIIHQILTNAQLRPKAQRRPVFLMVDEFQKFVCSDFADALNTLAGLGVYLILSCQHPSQISEENQQVYDSVDNNCGNKFVFSISRKEADQMAPELFTGWIHQDRVKDEVWQTKFRPVESIREIVSEGHGWDEGSSSSVTKSFERSNGGFLATPSSVSKTRAASGSYFGNETIVRAPWYEYEEFQELSSRTFYTPQEIIERYTSWVVKQDPRHLQMKIGSRKPIPVVTADLEEVRVLPSYLRQFRQKASAKSALPVPEIKKQIEGRITTFLEDFKLRETIQITTQGQTKVSFRQPIKRKASKKPDPSSLSE